MFKKGFIIKDAMTNFRNMQYEHMIVRISGILFEVGLLLPPGKDFLGNGSFLYLLLAWGLIVNGFKYKK